MKIAILSPFYPLRGGIAQFADHLLAELSKTHDVRGFSFKRQYPNFLFPGKTQLVEPIDRMQIHGDQLLDSVNPISYFRTAKSIRNFQPDVIITAYWMSFLSPSLGTVNRLLKNEFKTIALVHNFIPHEPKFYDTLLRNYFFKQQMGAICLSKTVANQVANAYPKLSVCSFPHPNYSGMGKPIARREALVRLDIIKSIEESKDQSHDASKKVLLFFGLIRKYKGLDSLLRVFNQLPQDYHLIVAGESYEDFERYQEIIDQSNFPENITVLNRFIREEEIETLFSAANLCVLPYVSATQSGVTALANNFELPVLATNVGGLHESIQNGIDGLLVAPKSDDALFTGIQKYFKEEKERQFRKVIRETNEKKTWSYFSSKIIQFIENQEYKI